MLSLCIAPTCRNYRNIENYYSEGGGGNGGKGVMCVGGRGRDVL